MNRRSLCVALMTAWLAACGGSAGGNGDGDGAPPPPAYSGGVCPTLTAGENSLATSMGTRRVLLYLPSDPTNAPVVFAWHWLEGGPYETAAGTGLYTLPNAIVALPFARGDAPFAWHTTSAPELNPDLRLFDDVLACLSRQFDVDPHRIWTTGVSAGALWSAYLVQHRGDYIAAAALLSGGQPDPSLAPAYQEPAQDVPVLLAWGGETDVYRIEGQDFVYNAGDPEVFSFAEASRVLSAQLREDGHFVVHCVGDYGHSLPPSPFEIIWPFLRDHPRGVEPEPWEDGVPSDASPLCTLP